MNGYLFFKVYLFLYFTISAPVSFSLTNLSLLSVARSVVSFLFPIDLLKSLIDLLKYLNDRVNHPDPTHTIQRTKR